ncbi:vasculin-like protein 1 [Paramormyrops kingsleyae]|uniref:GC-rich promoter binding protein 1 like 1 n=1 Tax=Paramormyrops kingsleyae TaxID=1676925 RepID=A0A3B3RKA5_9TELE|nr:vasculin-like protein 1 isoform X2 [Paramormyrops kingsleyae]
MAQHDFVPAWLNFSTPQPTKSPAAGFERPGEHLPRGSGRPGVSRRRHNSSDGFFNNGPLRAPTGEAWQQPSLLRHDSVDSGVSKGSQSGLAGGGPGWKETPSWHSAPRAGEAPHPHPHPHHRQKRGERERERQGHRQRGGTVHPRKAAPFQDKFSGEERRDGKEEKLKFVDEDFPSLNSEASGKPAGQTRVLAPPAGVWENPPSTKQPVSKMLVIKKVSKEDSGAVFSAGFASTGFLPTNGNKVPISGPSIYKNLVPKSTAATKTGPWKANGREAKPALHLSGQDSAFVSPVSAPKPQASVSTPSQAVPRELPSSTTPPIDITPPRLKLMRRGPDRKSDFLRALKDERNGERSSSGSPGTLGEGEGSTPDAKGYGEGVCHKNGIAHSLSDSDNEPQFLSSSLEAEHRLLKAMGWQEHPENDESFQPLTEDELKEFQTKTEQLKKNSFGRNGLLLKTRGVTLQYAPWRHTVDLDVDESSETSSSQTSDDENT